MRIINFLILGVLTITLVSAFSLSGLFQTSVDNPTKDINVTLDNFITSFTNNPIINDLPNGASIKLSIGEKNFFIGHKTIEKFDNQKVDIKVNLSKKYISELSTKNYCSVLRKAILEKDYKVNLEISKFGFIWKYSRLIKYRSCFGF